MKKYYRIVTLTNIVKDEKNGTVSGINDSGARVIMTIK